MPKVDVTACALAFRDEIKKEIEVRVEAGGPRPKLVGIIANKDEAAVMYARWTERACARDGIQYELRQVERVDLEDAVIEANEDPAVNGIIVYYPVFGGPIDDYLRDVISLEKDVEGLNHRYRYSLYHNIRVLSDLGNRKAILPCTPLAILKILNHLGAYKLELPVGEQAPPARPPTRARRVPAAEGQRARDRDARGSTIPPRRPPPRSLPTAASASAAARRPDSCAVQPLRGGGAAAGGDAGERWRAGLLGGHRQHAHLPQGSRERHDQGARERGRAVEEGRGGRGGQGRPRRAGVAEEGRGGRGGQGRPRRAGAARRAGVAEEGRGGP